MVIYSLSMMYEAITNSLVPWNYPNLSNKTITTSPFTIVFREAGSSMDFDSLLLPEALIYILSCRCFVYEHRHSHVRSFSWESCLICRHAGALWYGHHGLPFYNRICLTLLVIGLSVTTPPQAPRIFSRTTAHGIPLPALLLTSSVSGLCFGSSFIGSGTLWAWLQNLVGVSNQVCQMFGYCFCRLIAMFRLLGCP